MHKYLIHHLYKNEVLKYHDNQWKNISSTKTPGKEYLNIVWYSRHHKSFIAPLQSSVSFSSLFLLYKTWLCNIYSIWTLCMFITKLFDCLWLLYNVYNWNYEKFFFFETLKYPHNRNNGSICFCQALMCKKAKQVRISLISV